MRLQEINSSLTLVFHRPTAHKCSDACVRITRTSQPSFSGAIESSGENVMSKPQHSNKEAKKHALLTPKEKKAAKQVKKHAGDAVPLIVKGS